MDMSLDSESWNQIELDEWKGYITEVYPCATFVSHPDGLHAMAGDVRVGLHRHDGSAFANYDVEDVPIDCLGG